MLQSLSGRKEFEVKEQGRGMIPYDSIVEGPFFGSASYPQAKFLDNGGACLVTIALLRRKNK